VEVSSNMFSMLRVAPVLGRTFALDDEGPGRDHVVMLSYALWQTRFGGNPKMVGRTIVLNDVGYQIAGVMPQSFVFPSSTAELWVPVVINLAIAANMCELGYVILGRLRPGAAMAA